MNFWQKLPKPFFTLAPMANVTDAVFRRMITKYGKPDVMWTEFVSADGLISEGKKRLIIDLKYSPKERPIVAQLFSAHPEAMKKAVKIIAELGFDGLDINMGCPDRSVEKQGGGAAMMKNPKLAVKIIQAAREGTIPVSVKTRLGYNKVDFAWIRLLLEQKLPALTIHLRTRKEMSNVPAHWELMPEIVKMRDEISPTTLIIGNGDVVDVFDGALKCKRSGCDGVMIGRGIFGKPWVFEDVDHARMSKSRPSSERQVSPDACDGDTSSSRGGSDLRLNALLAHAKLFDKEFKNIKNFDIMKKHFKAYVSGWDGAKELRVKLMGAKNYKDVKKIIEGRE